MRRVPSPARQNWEAAVEQYGLSFHTNDGSRYWTEDAAYELTDNEVATLESATNELHRLCLEAVERVISRNEFDRLGINPAAHQAIIDAWENDPPAIYGRFDLQFSDGNPPKLLEYNADTPTSLLEAAVIQWHWLAAVHHEADQFNSIWEGLVEKWTALTQEGYFPSQTVHFASQNAMEDIMTTAVMMDTAREAGLNVIYIPVVDIGWDAAHHQFVDLDCQPIESMFKLYPWEWMVVEAFGVHAISPENRTQWLEPIWKMVLSNKAILAILWEMFPDHPNLLPAYFDGPRDLSQYVRKPFLGREGANVTIVDRANITQTDGPYDAGQWIYQGYAPLPCFDGNHAVIGSWVIDGESRGIGIRESDGPITEDLARFVPHYFNPAKP